MKRTQLIEWGIVTVALIFGYKFFDSLFVLLVQLSYDLGSLDKVLTRFIVLCAVYALSFVLLIRNSSQVAKWVSGPSPNDVIQVKINKRSLLQVILIGICVGTILSNIGYILLYLFEIFKNEAGRLHEAGDNMVSKYRFTIAALEAIVAFVLLYFSKDVSGWFIRKNKGEELTFESEAENDK
jgi:H+/gluconate symporter-like permease